jgi:hypothetical protein
MNDKIKQFALQADIIAPSENDIAPPMEKFALLIVAECVDKIETYRIPVGNSSAGEMACEWTYDALKEIRNDIHEHFGVE